MKATQNEIKDGKVCSIVMYIVFLIGLVWWLADEKMKKNKFVTYHLKQNLIIIIAAFAVSTVGGIIPFIGWFIILPIGSLVVFVLWVIGLINAIKGEEKPVPLIGKLAEKWFTF